MKHVISRILLAMMVMLLTMSIAMPATMAEKGLVSNTNRMTMYVGMKVELYVTTDGVRQEPSLFRWRSTNTKVVSVTSKGIITAKKVGSATIYITRKSNGNKLSMKVTVRRNKVDNLKPRPSAWTAPYKGVGARLKSVEIASPTRIVVEYYLCCNFPSNWKLTKIKSIQDAINIFDPDSGSFKKTIVGDDYQLWAKSVSGLKPRYGSYVQVIKATFTGSRIYTNVNLLDYKIDNSTNVQINYNYSYR